MLRKSSANDIFDLDGLPDLVLTKVLSHLSIFNLRNCDLVSVRLHQLTRENSIWKKRVSIEFPSYPEHTHHFINLRDNDEFNWRDKYIELFNYHYQLVSPRMQKIFTFIKTSNLAEIEQLDPPISFDELYVQDTNEITAIHFAAVKANQPVLDYLYKIVLGTCSSENGLSFEKANEEDIISILYSAILCHQSIDHIAFLLDTLQINQHPDFNVNLCMNLSVKYGHIDAMRLFYGMNVDIEFLFNFGYTLLLLASEAGQIEAIRFLLENGANVNALRSDGASSLFLAASGGHMEAVACLLDAGTDIHAMRRDSATPLCIAASQGHDHIVKLLLNRGADFNKFRIYLQSPMYVAMNHGHRYVIKELINAKQDINYKDPHGHTLMHLAYLPGEVKILCEFEANINALSNHGVTPLLIAVINNNMNLVRCLLENGADANLGINQADISKDPVTRYLLNKPGFDCISEDNAIVLPIDIARKLDQPEMVELLEQYINMPALKRYQA